MRLLGRFKEFTMVDTSSHSIGMYVDMSGRKLIGEVLDDNDVIVKLKNPVIINELVRNNNGRPVVDLNFSPEMHTFNIEEIEIKWCRRYKIYDKISNVYLDYVIKMNAARQGLEIIGTMPNNLPNMD